MRTSQKTMLIAIVLLAVMMVTAIVVGKFIAFDIAFNKNEKAEGPPVSEILELMDFDAVTIVGGMWDAKIEQSKDFYVEITSPRSIQNEYDIQVRKNELFITGPEKLKTFSKKNLLTIRAPSIKSLHLTGLGNIMINGFNEKTMKIVSNGAIDVSARNASADVLEVFVEGIGDIDLSGMAAVDATVILDGFAEVFVNMNGGVLKGSLDGLGTIRYKGSVTREEIKVDGWGSVVEQ